MYQFFVEVLIVKVVVQPLSPVWHIWAFAFEFHSYERIKYNKSILKLFMVEGRTNWRELEGKVGSELIVRVTESIKMDRIISFINSNDIESVMNELPTKIQSLMEDSSLQHQNLTHHQLSNLIDSLKESTCIMTSSDLIRIYTLIIHQLSMNQRSSIFEHHSSRLKEYLATQYEHHQDFTKAAHTLLLIPLESTQKHSTIVYRMQIYNRVVRLFLEDDDSISAETYLNRMAPGMHECNDLKLNLQYK